MVELGEKSETLRESARRATRTALLINGTGALLLLVFLAYLFELAHNKKLPVADFMMDLVGAFSMLLAGVLLVAVQHVIDSIGLWLEQKWSRLSLSFHAVRLLCIVASYVCFAYGAFQTRAAFLDYLPIP